MIDLYFWGCFIGFIAGKVGAPWGIGLGCFILLVIFDAIARRGKYNDKMWDEEMKGK